MKLRTVAVRLLAPACRRQLKATLRTAAKVFGGVTSEDRATFLAQRRVTQVVHTIFDGPRDIGRGQQFGPIDTSTSQEQDVIGRCLDLPLSMHRMRRARSHDGGPRHHACPNGVMNLEIVQNDTKHLLTRICSGTNRVKSLRLKVPFTHLVVIGLAADDTTDVDEVKLPSLTAVRGVDADPEFVTTETRVCVHTPFALVFRR